MGSYFPFPFPILPLSRHRPLHAETNLRVLQNKGGKEKKEKGREEGCVLLTQLTEEKKEWKTSSIPGGKHHPSENVALG